MQNKSINKIKAVGFDLDNTLYYKTPEIDNLIQDYICEQIAIVLKKDYTEVRLQFTSNYVKTQSGSISLKLLGIKNGKELVQKAIEYADVSSVLKKDEKLVSMLMDLKSTYNTFLITSSPENAAIKKISALGIEKDIFDPRLYGESIYLRDDGSAFRHIAKYLKLSLEEIMFVGDREKTDIIPAKVLGITTAIVNNKSEHADYNLTDIYQLKEILSR
jgi:FMN phosphatase YigB (HAD superfamily)